MTPHRMRRSLRLLLVPALVLAAGLLQADPALAAPWCGTPGSDDRAPAVAGNQVRVVYVLASDAEDHSATLLPQISADVDLIEDWWRSQDPTRTLRFDRAAFSCGAQADIEVMRSAYNAQTLRITDGRFQRIVEGVLALDNNSPFFKYLVYFDGALDSDQICGQGGGSFSGGGVAIVYTGGCAGEPSVATAAHELIHTLGALETPGAPNECTDNEAHVCDSSGDILWPYAQFAPLTVYALDAGRNDYYGHSGTWTDVQDSRWLRHLDAQSPLTLTFAGAGSITSDVPGVLCSASCTTEWDTGAAVVLQAQAASGQRFVRWGGGCAGVAPACSLSLAQATSVSALFGPLTYALRVSVGGKGTVRDGGRLACPTRCAVAEPSYTPARLTASPAKGWRFKSWSGACRGTRATCTVPMTKATAARAVFARLKKK